MLTLFKEKQWSVLLVRGYVLKEEIRGSLCANCKSTTHPLTANFGNPNLFLYGCQNPKCRHRMLRFDFGDSTSFKTDGSKLDEKTTG